MEKKLRKFPAGGRNGYIELCRLLFILAMVVYHTLGEKGPDWKPFRGAYVYVEYFFMLSGYFLMRYVETNRETLRALPPARTAMAYTLRKMKPVFPYSATALIIACGYQVIQLTLGGESFLKELVKGCFFLPMELFGLSQTGFIMEVRLPILWFLSALFLALPVVMYFCLKAEDFYKNIFVWLAPPMIYGIIMSKSEIIPASLLRSVAGLTLGCFVWLMSERLKKARLTPLPARC